MNNNMDNKKIIQMVAAIGLLCLFVGIAARVRQLRQVTLSDYAKNNPDIAYRQDDDVQDDGNTSDEAGLPDDSSDASGSSSSETSDLTHLTAYNPNSTEILAEIEYWQNTDITYDNICQRYGTLNADKEYECNCIDLFIATGGYNPHLIDSSADEKYGDETFTLDYSSLRFAYYDANHEVHTATLVAPSDDAVRLLHIFLILYFNGYEFDNITPIDVYDCNLGTARSANASFYYDGKFYFNSMVNPYVITQDGIVTVSAPESIDYIDRTKTFQFKIDSNDFLYVLLTKSGYTWAGTDENPDYALFSK